VVFTAGAPLTIFPLDVTHKALMLPEHVDRLERYDTRVSRAAVGMLRFYERYDVDRYDIPGAPLHDPCVIAYLIDPTMFSGHTANVTVGHTDEETMGNTSENPDGAPTATIMTDVDAERFFDLVTTRVGSL